MKDRIMEREGKGKKSQNLEYGSQEPEVFILSLLGHLPAILLFTKNKIDKIYIESPLFYATA